MFAELRAAIGRLALDQTGVVADVLQLLVDLALGELRPLPVLRVVDRTRYVVRFRPFDFVEHSRPSCVRVRDVGREAAGVIDAASGGDGVVEVGGAVGVEELVDVGLVPPDLEIEAIEKFWIGRLDEGALEQGDGPGG